MATYYVRTDGSDSNAGTGPATNQAWQTITKAIGATGIAPGDTLYIAPGVYRGSFTAAFTNPASEGQRVSILGNPTASQFSGITAGPVILTNYTSNTAATTGSILLCNKDFVTLRDLSFCSFQPGAPPYYMCLEAQNNSLIVEQCLFWQASSNLTKYLISLIVSAGLIGPVVRRCVFINGPLAISSAAHSGAWNTQTRVQDCLVLNNNANTINSNDGINLYSSTTGQFGGVQITNCTVSAANGIHVITNSLSSSFPSYIQNCYIEANLVGIKSDVSSTTTLLQTYNIINAPTSVQNVSASGTTVTNALNPINAGISKIQGWGDYPFISPLSTIQSAINAGVNTYSPAADMFGTTWLAPSTPTIGASEFQSYTPTGSYLPTERNASTITIAPGSTSQSIELYLGVTGLTFATSGLAAYYVRNQSAPVAITLVTQTATGAWSSGGFAEISSSLVPGVYRLDVPNAAFAAGASDVTIVVRGASGTNGAVLTVTLSSGGLTAAQTAAAVWDEPYTSHTTASTFGARTLKTTVDNRNVDVGSSFHIQSNVHAIVDSTAAASELSGALLHNGIDYISAELVTPVTSAALVRMGPFEVRADGLGASDPLDIQKGAQHGIDIQCVDNNGAGIDITSATVTAKVYNSGATLVSTLACTATYAADGRAQFTLTTTVTNVPGTYTATITRSTSANDTQIFGPLRIYVRDI
jgi:hypothetical protein